MKVGASLAAVQCKRVTTMVDLHDCTLKIFGENNGVRTTPYSDWATHWMTKESGLNSWQGQRSF